MCHYIVMADGTARVSQLTFDRVWQGKRRKRKRKKDAGVPHRKREELQGRFPVLVTLKVREGVPGLRNGKAYNVIADAFRKGRNRPGRLVDGEFRLVHYSIQQDHLHLIVEAKDRASLSHGVQGLGIRLARKLNAFFGISGRFFRDRYHDRILRSPTEVRNALRYVLGNGRKHGRHRDPKKPDPFSSGPWFEGWKDYVYDNWLGPEGPVAKASTWLLNVGWRRLGLLRVAEAPRS